MDIELLNLHHQSRNKIWHWSEAYSYSGLTQISATKYFDPNLALIFSPKNQIDSERILKYYFNSDLFKISQNSYGISSKLNLATSIWAGPNFWYFRQLLLGKYGNFLYSIPFTQQVFVCGSTTLEIANSTSDIDLIIQSKFPWISRVYYKIIFKLLQLDSYPFVSSWLWKWQKQPNFKTQILNYKKSLKPRFDFGLICKNLSDIEQFYTEPERQFSIYNRFLVLKNNQVTTQNQIRHQDYPKYRIVFGSILKVFLFLFLPIVWVIVQIYKPLTINFNSKSKTLIIKNNFISFYPTNYQL
jgi:hypothetical protein